MKRLQLMFTLTAWIWFWGAGIAAAQTQEQQEAIRVDTSLVSVPVTVTDSFGRFVTGLSRSDFRIMEDGKPQEIATFLAADAPFTVALLIDTSRSTLGEMNLIRNAAIDFVKQLQPQDRVLVVTFDEKINFLGDFTSDRARLQRLIKGVKSNYLTRIYDAISLTITEKLMPIKGRKAIVVFSDGVDTYSGQASYESTLDLVARSGVLVYAVQYNSPLFHDVAERMQAQIEKQRTAIKFLRALAEQSGARPLRADYVENSGRNFALIADELRHQYTLEYYSTNDQHDGGYHSIAVSLKRNDLSVRTRQGYTAASKAESK
ncbi:MAG: VWA domain-containing protein [Blastocatellia bacterium]|nr:VWA domain-containing protein [Blastocatellia bacterium]